MGTYPIRSTKFAWRTNGIRFSCRRERRALRAAKRLSARSGIPRSLLQVLWRLVVYLEQISVSLPGSDFTDHSRHDCWVTEFNGDSFLQ